MTEKENTDVNQTVQSESDVEYVSETGEISAEPLNLSQAAASIVKAETVRINQAGAQQVIATEVEVMQGAVNRIQADTVKISDSVAALINSGSIDLKDCAIGAIRTQQLYVRDGGAVVIRAETLTMEDGSSAGAIIANQVAGGSINTKLLLAGHVEGNVETSLDTKQVLFAGVAAGAVIGLFLLAGQLFSDRG
jgi:hypothetical protein